jgi:AraC family transcriptional regulator
LTLSEYRYAPELSIPAHAHSLAYFCLVLRGSYHERYGARSRECTPPMIVFHPEGETHSDHFHSAGGHLFSVETDSTWLERVQDYVPVLSRPAEITGGAAYSLGIKLFRELSEEDTASPLAIEALTLEILCAATRSDALKERWRPGWLRAVEAYLKAHFRDEVGLDGLSLVAGVHRSHLARTFRAYYHCTAGEYVRRLRIEHACQQLGKRDTEIALLATHLGFADASHFTRTFKRITGHTPAEYRRILSVS